MYEVVCKSFRAVVLLICYLFINDLKVMIYISIVVMFLSIFIKIKKINKKDFEFEQ
jgi:hypothetical protein